MKRKNISVIWVSWTWACKASQTLGFSLDRFELSRFVIKPPRLVLVYVEDEDGIAPARDVEITQELARIALARLRKGKSEYWAAQVALRATGMPGEDARIERESDLVARLIVTLWKAVDFQAAG